jgi:hypothetical protein
MNLLQQFELEEVEQTEQKERFEITDINSLNWAFRKLSAYKAKEQEITELAQAERARIDMWEAEEKKKVNDSIEFFETLINEYHSKVLSEDPKAKTLSTPYGKSRARQVKPQPKKANEKAILEHVVNSGMEDYIKPALKWADLKKNIQIAEINGRLVAVDENGEEIPGVTVEPEQIKFSTEVE